MDRYTYFSSRSNHFDILSAIDSKIKKLLIQWKQRHAKVHQYGYFGPLHILASLNVEYDHSENRIWEQDQEKTPET